MKILAFGHRSDMGKDTAAGFALRHLRTTRPDLNVQKMEFARPLKQITYYLFAWAGIKEPEYYETNRDARKNIIDALGMNMIELWVQVGQVMRDIYPDVWIKSALNCNCDVLILSDLRFPNEISAIREHDSKLIKITRDIELLPTEADMALVDFEDWDHIVENQGSLQELYTNITEFVNDFA